jgi:hypothetical protein
VTKLKAPHLLLASSNPLKLRANLAHIVTPAALRRIDSELNRNVIALFRLGETHFDFAHSLPPTQWRQKISRCYYGAYNIQRAVRLRYEGGFSTDTTDHRQIGQLPDLFPDRARYAVSLVALREDRNLADYSHDSVASDLVLSVADADALVQSFASDSLNFLRGQGVTI